MTAAWPIWLKPSMQNASLDNYTEQPEDNIAEFDPDVGPPKRRRRTSLPTDLVNFNLDATNSDYEDLRAFHRAQLKDGVLPFTMLHPRNKTTGTWIFVSPPKISQALGPFNFEVAFSLRLMSGGVLLPTFKFNAPRNSQYVGMI